MAKNVYGKLELVGTSTESLSDAVQVAVAKAQETVKNLGWFEVTEQRGAIRDGKVEFQVTISVGYRLD
jgi:flavin-binding protein dodecin